jgi:hypothetical protein
MFTGSGGDPSLSIGAGSDCETTLVQGFGDVVHGGFSWLAGVLNGHSVVANRIWGEVAWDVPQFK